MDMSEAGCDPSQTNSCSLSQWVFEFTPKGPACVRSGPKASHSPASTVKAQKTKLVGYLVLDIVARQRVIGVVVSIPA